MQTINEALKTAMKEKDQVQLRALRAIKSALLLAQTEKAGAVVDAAREIQVLQKLAKQRRDSMAIFKEQNRNDLFEREQEELLVIETFLPASLSEAEILAKVAALAQAAGVSTMADLSKLMPLAMKELAGKADNKAIADAVKQILGGK
jgi:hypothetical protein